MCFFSVLTIAASAQTVVTKSYAVKPGEKVELNFDYPKIVRISTWDKNEVSVVAKVSINDGENDNAFVLEDQSGDGVVSIKNTIKNMKDLPRRYTVVRDGLKTVYRSKEDYNAAGRMSGAYSYSEGVDMEITVEVKVPANTATSINAKYGMVEMVNFNAPVTVNATYGGIDATVAQASTGKLRATTHYGRIYSNLDLKITDKENRDFFTSITAEPGRGPAYDLKSTYGKIYLRKPLGN